MRLRPWARLAAIGLLSCALLACRSVPDAPAAEPLAPTTPVPAPQSDGEAATPTAAEIRDAEFPASYDGTLACADCRGHRLILNLFADGTYYLRETWLGRPGGDETYDDIGRWAGAADGKTVELHGGRERPLRFTRHEDGSLHAVAEAGATPATDEQFLMRDPGFRDLEPRLPLRGMFRYLADTATFTECLTGRTMPVAMEANFLDLDRAYRALDKSPGQAFLVTVEGRIAERDRTLGQGTQDTLVVDRFRRFWPKEGCGPRYAEAPFEGTRWKLVQMGGYAVLPGVSPQEASLSFDAATRRLSGSTGCNRVGAGYTMDAGVVRLTPPVITRMACPAAAMQRESEFVAMLGKLVLATVVGQQLEFRDGAGTLIARFDAMPAE